MPPPSQELQVSLGRICARPKQDWLSSCLTSLPQHSPQPILDRYLLTDLSESSRPIDELNSQDELHQLRLATAAPVLMQVVRVIDIGLPALTMLDALKERAERRKRIRAGRLTVPGGNQEATAEVKLPRGTLKITLTDGSNQIEAIEYRTLTNVSISTPPGTKVLITDVRVLRRVMLLEQRNIRVVWEPLQNDDNQEIVERAIIRHLKETLRIPLEEDEGNVGPQPAVVPTQVNGAAEPPPTAATRRNGTATAGDGRNRDVRHEHHRAVPDIDHATVAHVTHPHEIDDVDALDALNEDDLDMALTRIDIENIVGNLASTSQQTTMSPISSEIRNRALSDTTSTISPAKKPRIQEEEIVDSSSLPRRFPTQNYRLNDIEDCIRSRIPEILLPLSASKLCKFQFNPTRMSFSLKVVVQDLETPSVKRELMLGSQFLSKLLGLTPIEFKEMRKDPQNEKRMKQILVGLKTKLVDLRGMFRLNLCPCFGNVAGSSRDGELGLAEVLDVREGEDVLI